MPDYNLIITDVTRYGSSLYCVAGWDTDRERMIRPEPATADVNDEPSRFWGANYVEDGKFFAVGNRVQISAKKPPAHFPFPHATEDRILVAGSSVNLVEQLTDDQVVQLVAGSVSASPMDVFEGHLKIAHTGKSFVPANTETASLGAIEIDPEQISFYSEQLDNGKHRLSAVIDCEGVKYRFSVPADAAKRRFLEDGIAGLEADAKNSDLIHVRIGLSRPFDGQPNSCYTQINGLLFL